MFHKPLVTNHHSQLTNHQLTNYLFFFVPLCLGGNIFQKISRFALDFSTLIFALILRVVNFGLKTRAFLLISCQFLSKTIQKVQKSANFRIFSILNLTSYF